MSFYLTLKCYNLVCLSLRRFVEILGESIVSGDNSLFCPISRCFCRQKGAVVTADDANVHG